MPNRPMYVWKTFPVMPLLIACFFSGAFLGLDLGLML